MKGLTVNVYRNSDHIDCTYSGISSKFSRLTILPTESTNKVGINIPGIFHPSEDCPGIYIFHRPQFDDLIACPDIEYGTGKSWWMFGGNFIYTSDSRFPAKNPIKVFDRNESSKQPPLIINKRLG